MTLFGHALVFMAPMRIVNGLFCGKSYYGCEPDGTWHGV